MHFAYDITSGFALALLGFFALLIGAQCVEVHGAARGERSPRAFLWDVLIGAVTAGTSLGYVAAVLFVAGISFIAIGTLVVVTSLIWAVV